MAVDRTLWRCDNMSENSGEVQEIDRYERDESKKANLVSSKLTNGNHAPAIDIDLPCELRESSTPGHFHLLIEKELTWEQYRLLLAVLADLGIVEQGYYRASLARGQSFLRLPGVKKGG